MIRKCRLQIWFYKLYQFMADKNKCLTKILICINEVSNF